MKMSIPVAQLQSTLEKFPITEIKLYGRVEPGQLEALANANKLERLDLSECVGITDQMYQLLSEIGSIQALKSLKIRVPGGQVRRSLRRFPNLTELQTQLPRTPMGRALFRALIPSRGALRFENIIDGRLSFFDLVANGALLGAVEVGAIGLGTSS